jgi:hypothetical protein
VVRRAQRGQAAGKRQRRAADEQAPRPPVVARDERLVHVVRPRHHLDHDKHEEHARAKARDAAVVEDGLGGHEEEAHEAAGPQQALPEPQAGVQAQPHVALARAPEQRDRVQREEAEGGKAEAQDDLLPRAQRGRADDAARALRRAHVCKQVLLLEGGVPVAAQQPGHHLDDGEQDAVRPLGHRELPAYVGAILVAAERADAAPHGGAPAAAVSFRVAQRGGLHGCCAPGAPLLEHGVGLVGGQGGSAVLNAGCSTRAPPVMGSK